MMERCTHVENSSPCERQFELKHSHTHGNAESAKSEFERTPSMDIVYKAERRGAIIISSSKNSAMSDSIVKQLASMEITPKKRKSIPSYRTLMKKRAHSRRKNRVIIVENKVMKTMSPPPAAAKPPPLAFKLNHLRSNDGDRQGDGSG